MTRQRLVMFRAAWASFALGTLLSLTLNAGVTGCSNANNQQVESPSTSNPTAEDCMPRFLGATKAAPVLPPGCERPPPAQPSPQAIEQAPRQAQ